MRQTICILLFFLFSIPIQAQNTQLENLVKGFFKNPAEIKWLKHYSGDIDDINKVAVTLASDGYQCKGTMTYLRSNEILKLEGNHEGDILKLAEINKRRDTSGFLLGKMGSDNIAAEWTNYDGSIGRVVNLKEIKKQVASFNDFDNQWIKKYKGVINLKDEFEILLQRLNSNEIKGVAYDNKTNELLAVNGTINDANQMMLTFENAIGKKVGTLKAEPSQRKELVATYTGPSGKENHASFGLNSRMEVESINYADYSTSYEILYPKSDNKVFNYYIKNLLKEWVVVCEDQVRFINEKNLKENPTTRATRRAYAWFDMAYISKNIISGEFSFTNTWNDKVEGKSFNFDLKKGEEIELDDLVKKNASFRGFFTKYVRKKVKTDPRFSDKDFRDWISKDRFDHFTVQKTGITFSTLFDEIYGKFQFTIPYNELTPFLRNNNPILK